MRRDPMPQPTPQATQPKWSAILEVQDPDGTRTRHPFRHPRIKVGRRRDNDLSLADEGVSHQHCEFVSEQGYFVVRDLGSQNGTWLNERRVGEARLRDGDEVRIGATRIRIALEGGVRRPERRSRWRIAGVLLGLAAAGGSLWLFARREQEKRVAYAALLREEVPQAPCAAPQFAELEKVDAQIGGRSFALTLQNGELKLTREDLALDGELAGLHRRKLALYQDAYRGIGLAQQPRREAAERLSRLGQRLWTSRERKAAAFVDGLLQDRIQAADDLAQALRQLIDDTTQLTGLVATLPMAPPAAKFLREFRFKADLRAARAACEQKDAAASAGLAGALTALAE
ncbi:MAG: FHA domain-containing protein [Myxococcales bacterium]